MWDFFKELLEKHGLAALIIAALLVGIAWLVRFLLKRWQCAQTALVDQAKAHAKALAAKDVQIAEMEKEHSEELRTVTVQFSERIYDIQERRVEEAREVTKAVVKHVEHTKNSVEKITTAMETLSSAVSRR